jgi:hypothetical protein
MATVTLPLQHGEAKFDVDFTGEGYVKTIKFQGEDLSNVLEQYAPKLFMLLDDEAWEKDRREG